MEVPTNLLEAAERKLSKLDAFLDESGWVEIGFVEEQNPRIAEKYLCEIVAHVKGHRLKVEGHAAEPLGALDRAADKVDRQVRRLKDKRVKRRRGNHSSNGPASNGDLPAALVPDLPDLADEAAPAAPSATDGDLPTVVDAGEVDAKPMTPVEAAMQLDVLGQDFVLFHNAESGRPAVVYRRRDGDYGLVQMPA